MTNPRYILKVAETKQFPCSKLVEDNLTEDELLVFNQIEAEITDDILYGTVVYKDEKLVCMAVSVEFGAFGILITDYELPWEIMAASNGYEYDPELGKIKVLPKKFKINKFKKFMKDGETFDFGEFQGDVGMEGEE